MSSNVDSELSLAQVEITRNCLQKNAYLKWQCLSSPKHGYFYLITWKVLRERILWIPKNVELSIVNQLSKVISIGQTFECSLYCVVRW